MRGKNENGKQGPHANRVHPVGTAAHAVAGVDHAPVKHRPTVPKSLRKKSKPYAIKP